jgi:GLPGLI family protein
LVTYAGRDYKAWFTNEIPVSDGPYKFYGLPGLIVEIEDSKKQYTFELVSYKTFSEKPKMWISKRELKENGKEI